MPTPPRSVKIPENERGGWSSERPRRPGEPERPPRLADVSVRGRVLAPSDRLRYAPGSLLLLVGADAPNVEALAARVLEDSSILLSLAKLRGMLEGRVPEGEVDEKAQRAARRHRRQAARLGPDGRDRVGEPRRGSSASATSAPRSPIAARAT